MMLDEMRWLWTLLQVLLVLGFNLWCLRRAVRARRSAPTRWNGLLLGLVALLITRRVYRGGNDGR